MQGNPFVVVLAVLSVAGVSAGAGFAYGRAAPERREIVDPPSKVFVPTHLDSLSTPIPDAVLNLASKTATPRDAIRNSARFAPVDGKRYDVVVTVTPVQEAQ